MTQEPSADKPLIPFQNKYVAFIDVLGFTELVFSNSQKELLTYFEVINLAFNVFNIHKRKLQKIVISDSIILVAEDTDEDFKMLLEAVRTLQGTFAMSNIWLRGGIAYGEVYHEPNSDIIVGKGYIRAYLLESEAIYPRVIIDPAIVDKMGLDLQGFYNKFNTGDNGQMKLLHDYGFIGKVTPRITPDDAIPVSYAHRIIMDSMREYKNVPENGLKRVYDHLRKRLYGPQKHYHKYLWVKKYFAETLNELVRLQVGEDNDQRVWMDKMAKQFASL